MNHHNAKHAAVPLTLPDPVQVNPAFFPMMPDAEFDSFLTIGLDGPALTPGALSTVGLDLAGWNERAGISSDNGAVRGQRLSTA